MLLEISSIHNFPLIYGIHLITLLSRQHMQEPNDILLHSYPALLLLTLNSIICIHEGLKQDSEEKILRVSRRRTELECLPPGLIFCPSTILHRFQTTFKKEANSFFFENRQQCAQFISCMLEFDCQFIFTRHGAHANSRRQTHSPNQ